MEYSPMMVMMLWALTPSDCWPIDSGHGEQARVVEMPQPIMSVHPEGGYFTFNHGRPFLVEKDPLTGAIDSNIKTTPVSSDDYLYEEYEESGESIDRKDNTKLYTRNDITSPSKDSDLHKFLNLPVHYSSSGKFPLISSSYANMKVQGHGPLSNHKLYTPSSTSSPSVSPSYFPLKTTETADRTTTIFTTTTKALPTTTKAPPTTTTTIAPVTHLTTTKKTTATTKMTTPFATTKSTTTYKPFFSYEYDYDYDYDKHEGDGSENTSHDYAFLGTSSEDTKPSTSSPTKTPNTILPELNFTKVQTTQTPSTPLPTSTTKPPTSVSLPKDTTTFNNDFEKKLTMPFIKEKIDDKSKPNLVESASPKQPDTIDLKPPSPELSIELKPPQLDPIQPFSPVNPSSLPEFDQSDYVLYPKPVITAEDKRPVTFYTPHNNSNVNEPEVIATEIHNSHIQEDKTTPPGHLTPTVTNKGEQLQKNSSDKDEVKKVEALSTAETYSSKVDEDLVKDHNKNISFEDKKNSIKPQETVQKFSNNRPILNVPATHEHSLFLANTYETNNKPLLEERPGRPTGFVHKRPTDIAAGGHIRHEEPAPEHKFQGVIQSPEYLRPQTNKYPGMLFGQSPRPIQEHRIPTIVKAPGQPQNILQEIRPHGPPNSETQKLARPQDSMHDNSSPLSVQTKPDFIRLQSHYYSQYKPQIHYTPEPIGSPSYQVVELNNNPTPGHLFGIRNERPQSSERPLGVEMRPQLHQEHKKPVSSVRPIQGVDSERESTKPMIFSKPQSGKRPDYNVVQFGQPSKVENHFISVSPGQENPSYSLQTSFSIGVPPPDQKQPASGGHGVGQVLFPDEEMENRPTPKWTHQRPLQQDNLSNIQIEKYPRPPWESHLKPPHMFQKKEQFPPIKRKPLPNILPQFRPNAKIGHAEPHVYVKPREPFDTLQPPPLPRPQFLRLEQDQEEIKPLVHRRNGQSSNRVTTLQMMQSPPVSKHASLRIDDNNEKNEPVFVVYPSNGNNPPAPTSDGVVVGTRGPHRPLPPDTLDIGDDLDSFPLDSNQNFQARVDTPVLKSKPPTSKPLIKNDFPYALIKPNPEDKITPGSVVSKDYTAFSPTVASIEKEHDTEINIIPYLQDYMPFATKKPIHKDTWLLNTDVKHLTSPTSSKQPEKITSTIITNDNHKIETEGPQPQDFQAPFHASLTAPSQGWSVVQKKTNKDNSNEESTTAKESNETETTPEPKFDIQNFKPQLFGGFKPIVPPVDSENKENIRT